MSLYHFLLLSVLFVTINSFSLDLKDYHSNFHEDKDSYHVLVETLTGKVEGFQRKVLNTTINEFRGIPYARPPVGRYRFKPPEPVSPWLKPFKALHWAPRCVQDFPHDNMVSTLSKLTTHERSEDCLYLNIWAPARYGSDLKPVLVWIHGGSFLFGTASLKETMGDVLAAYGDVVVVSFNYRVSAFGFLNFDYPDAPGNMGLLDQQMAFKWIKDNIKYFGGDPNLITLVGQGSGAVSVGMHFYSPNSRNLFKRAIMQSGSPVLFHYLYHQSEKTSKKFVELLGCSKPSADNLTNKDDFILENLRCINNQPMRNIQDVMSKIMYEYPFPFYPSLGSHPFPVTPFESFKNPFNYQDKKDLLIGFNKDEGTVFLHYALRKELMMNRHFVNSSKKAYDTLKELFETRWTFPKQLKDETLNYFQQSLQGSLTSDEYLLHLAKVYGDNMIICPTLLYAELFSKLEDKHVYLYNFTQPSSNQNLASWLNSHHYHDVPYVFGEPLRENPDHLYTKEEVELSKRMMNTWTYFAKTGSVLDQMQVKWPQFDVTHKQYMELNSATATVGHVHNSAFTADETCKLFKHMLDSGADLVFPHDVKLNI